MASCGHQTALDKNRESSHDQHVVVHAGRTFAGGVGKRSADMAKESQVSLEHNHITDVMFVDLCEVIPGSYVEVLNVNAMGFDGQIQARVDRERGIVYGLTIQNFKRFRRRLLWKKRMLSTRRAIEFLIAVLIAALDLDRRHHLAGTC